MIGIAGQPILTAAEMRAAEDRAIATGTSASILMRRAGEAIAAAARRLSSGDEVLVVCGPGNNGGDGYIAAAALARMGHGVRVAALAPPTTAIAKEARAAWSGEVVPLGEAAPAPVLIDCLFGTGLSRPLTPACDAALARLAQAARITIATDVPSGVDADTGSAPDWAVGHPATVTLALGALKPGHVLYPAAAACGQLRVIDLGIACPSTVSIAGAPKLPAPGPDTHKYTRGMVGIVAGAMEGAAHLAAMAALRSGAGYVALYGARSERAPDAIVYRPYNQEALADPRIGAILIGPGLGRDDGARDRLRHLIDADTHPLVIDGDALHLTDPAALRRRRLPIVLTPHAGEFRALFGEGDGSLLDRARAAAERSGAVIVLKGPTTIVADGAHTSVHPGGSAWLSTAGTGDVLAGAIAAQLAHPGTAAMDAANAGVWLHARAARLSGASFIADDLAKALTPARAGR